MCDDYDALQVPVYMVGGWNDAYTNAIPRFLEGYGGPRKGLIGPWSHNYPEVGTPGPAIGFLQETLRWFDHWLRDRETGIMDEPQLRVWMQEWAAPSPRHAHRDGRWITEPSWPSPAIEAAALRDRRRAGSATPTPPMRPCAATRTTRTAPTPATGARTARPPTSRPTSARRTGARSASTPTR